MPRPRSAPRSALLIGTAACLGLVGLPGSAYAADTEAPVLTSFEREGGRVLEAPSAFFVTFNATEPDGLQVARFRFETSRGRVVEALDYGGQGPSYSAFGEISRYAVSGVYQLSEVVLEDQHGNLAS